MVRASEGRLDRLVDMSVAHGVWATQVGGQSLEAGNLPRLGCMKKGPVLRLLRGERQSLGECRMGRG